MLFPDSSYVFSTDLNAVLGVIMNFVSCRNPVAVAVEKGLLEEEDISMIKCIDPRFMRTSVARNTLRLSRLN